MPRLMYLGFLLPFFYFNVEIKRQMIRRFFMFKNRRGHMEMKFSLISEKIYAPLEIFKIIVEV